jgi:hypothetical protein
MVKWGNHVYSLVGYSGSEKGDTGRCVLRSSLPITRDTWEILTSNGFAKPGGDPYLSGPTVHCRYVSKMPGFVGSIGRVVNTDLFVAIVAENDREGGSIVAYFSKDLVNWNGRQVLKQVSLFWSANCTDGRRYTYPSLIDEKSLSPNFDEVGETAMLYLVQGACRVGTNRALVKVPVKLSIPLDVQ